MNFGGSYKNLIQPDKLHVLSISILIDGLTNTRGGTAANITYNLALLGEHPILLCSIGEDNRSYLASLKKLGINTDYAHVSNLPTATFTVLTDQDNNQIGGFYPGAMSDISQLTLKPWYKSKDTLVVISATDPRGMDQLVSECQRSGLPYVYDVGQQVTNITLEELKHGLTGADILFANDYELGVIKSRTGINETELNNMIPQIVTTLGEAGTRITGKTLKQPLIIPSVKDVKVVDPTGAGDAYRAGFLYGYMRNWDLVDCARLGSVVATYTIELAGTQTHTFTLADLQQKYYSAYGTKLTI